MRKQQDPASLTLKVAPRLLDLHYFLRRFSVPSHASFSYVRSGVKTNQAVVV